MSNKTTIEEAERFTPCFGTDGLMPCVAVDAETGDVLMLAWVNAEALERTFATGYAHYFSRSRGAVWRKGETSGAGQAVREVRTDCDQDALVYLVTTEQRAGTCHTGRVTCFYRVVEPAAGVDGGPRRLRFDPA